MKSLSYLLLSSFILFGCQKVRVDEPDFNVSVDKLTLRAGDTATFSFSGNPDLISFFSGELGRSYVNRSRTTMAGAPKLVFQSNMTQGVLTNPDSLRIYVSSNLRSYDSTGVMNATWVDITSRNTRWPTALSTTFITSDSIDLSDFNNIDSVNIAFRVTSGKYPTAQQRRRQIQNVTLTNQLADGSRYNIFSTFASVGWVQANIKNNPFPNLSATNFHAWNVGEAGVNALNSRLVIGGRACNSNGIPIQTAYPITFDPSTANNVDDNDDWLITAAVNLKTVRPDVGTAIKRSTDVTLTSYKYRFTTPGTYTVTFVAQNQRIDIAKEVVRQIQIVVNP